MSKIKQLPPTLANQIAAGEVVERPASVVKELLENAIDAKSKRINVDIENGGMTSIRIRDDGIGIGKEDLPLALARHATSKLQTIDDLYQIASLGFRGEALASIASVSQFSLTSKYHNAEHAWQLKTEGKDLTLHIEPAPHPIGTTIEVNNIFYNVPARRKFLRSARTEFIHIEEIIKRMALANFSIAFSLRHNDKNILQLQKIDDFDHANNRIAKIFGHPFTQHAIYFEKETHDFKCYGWFSSPEVTRSQNDQQYFYINGRIVRDKLINHAIRQASSHLFPEGRFPAYVIYLTLPPCEVDVNVHPTKHEVRFKEARLVHDFIYQTINAMLSSLTTSVITSQEDAINLSTAYQACQTSHRQSSPELVLEENKHDIAHEAISAQRQISNTSQSKPVLLLQQQFDQYILAYLNKTLFIVDLSACIQHLIEIEINNQSPIPVPLLLPITIELDEKMIIQFEKFKPLLYELMIDIAVISEATLVIRSMPKSLRYIDWHMLLKTLCRHGINEKKKLIQCFGKHIALPEQNTDIEKVLTLITSNMELLETRQCIKKITASLLNKLF